MTRTITPLPSRPTFLAQRQSIEMAIAAVHSRRRLTKALRVQLAGLESALVRLAWLQDLAAATSFDEVDDMLRRLASEARGAGRAPWPVGDMLEAAE